MEKKIDWSKAPEGATHFGPDNHSWFAAWYKKVDGKWYGWLDQDDTQWDRCAAVGPRRESQMTARPVEQAPAIDWSKAPEWADRVVEGPMGGNKYWANEYRRVSFDGEYNLKNALHIQNNWQVLEHRPAASAWNGEGLPPVGLTVETVCGGVVRVVEILCITERSVFLREPTRNIEWLWDRQNPGSRTFRPIKTPEQIAAEEQQAALAEILETINAAGAGGSGKATARALYDAGYRKQ